MNGKCCMQQHTELFVLLKRSLNTLCHMLLNTPEEQILMETAQKIADEHLILRNLHYTLPLTIKSSAMD